VGTAYLLLMYSLDCPSVV